MAPSHTEHNEICIVLFPRFFATFCYLFRIENDPDISAKFPSFSYVRIYAADDALLCYNRFLIDIFQELLNSSIHRQIANIFDNNNANFWNLSVSWHGSQRSSIARRLYWSTISKEYFILEERTISECFVQKSIFAVNCEYSIRLKLWFCISCKYLYNMYIKNELLCIVRHKHVIWLRHSQPLVRDHQHFLVYIFSVCAMWCTHTCPRHIIKQIHCGKYYHCRQRYHAV